MFPIHGRVNGNVSQLHVKEEKPSSIPSPKIAVCVYLFCSLTLDCQVLGVSDIPAFTPRSLTEPC